LAVGNPKPQELEGSEQLQEVVAGVRPNLNSEEAQYFEELIIISHYILAANSDEYAWSNRVCLYSILKQLTN
jgi:hypothetical protein